MAELTPGASNTQLVDCVWTAAHCRMPHYEIRYRDRDIDERRKRARARIEPLMEAIDLQACSMDQLVKLMLALYKAGLDNFLPELKLIEKRVLAEIG
jgi:hypothetical protein